MERILIIGGAGFIGYHLSKKMIHMGYHVSLFDNFSRGVNDGFLKEIDRDEKIRIINDNLLNKGVIDRMETNYTYIYNLAAIIGVQHVLKKPYDVLVKNVELMKNAVSIAQKQTKLKRFIFTSTSEVYAGTLKHFNMRFPTPEATPLSITDLNDNRTSYMLSKIYGETMCYHSGLPVTVIRPHNFYGPRMGMSHVIPELLKKIYNAKDDSLKVYSVDHKRTFCFIEDAVEIMIQLAESDKTVGDYFNVGIQDAETSIGSLAKILLEVVGKDLKIDPQPTTPGSPVRRCPSMDKTYSHIDYQPRYSLKEGITKTFDWYRDFIFDKKEVSAI